MVVCMPVPLTRLSWDPTPRETPMRPLTLFAVLLATLAACRDAARRESREYSSGQAVADRVGAARAVPAARPEAAPALMRARERAVAAPGDAVLFPDRKSTRLNSSHSQIS